MGCWRELGRKLKVMGREGGKRMVKRKVREDGIMKVTGKGNDGMG